MRALSWCALACLAFGACGGSPTSPSPAPSLVGLTISSDSVAIPKHGTADLKAVAQWSNGSTADVTAKALWTSSNPEIASVQRGAVVGVSTGTAMVTAGYEGFLRTAAVTIRRPLSIATRAYVFVTPAAAGLQGVELQLDGRTIAQCSPTPVNPSSCEATTDPRSPDGAVAPGHHVLAVSVSTTAQPPDSLLYREVRFSILDADTSQTLTYASRIERGRLADGLTWTWAFDVDAYR